MDVRFMKLKISVVYSIVYSNGFRAHSSYAIPNKYCSLHSQLEDACCSYNQRLHHWDWVPRNARRFGLIRFFVEKTMFLLVSFFY